MRGDTHTLVAFLNEAAVYFERRDTGGEDSAFWSNVVNAENCRKAAKRPQDADEREAGSHALHRKNFATMEETRRRLERYGKSSHELSSAIDETREFCRRAASSLNMRPSVSEDGQHLSHPGEQAGNDPATRSGQGEHDG